MPHFPLYPSQFLSFLFANELSIFGQTRSGCTSVPDDSGLCRLVWNIRGRSNLHSNASFLVLFILNSYSFFLRIIGLLFFF